MSGGRPEVILPQDPTPVLGLCVLGFPLWAPPWFSAIQLGLGSAPHCTPDWTTYEGDLKGHLIPGVLSLFCFLLSCEEEKDGQRLFGQKKARVQYSFTKHSLTRFVPLSTWGTQEHFGEKLFKLPPFLLSSYMKYVSISQCTVFICTAFKSLKPLFSDAGPVMFLF